MFGKNKKPLSEKAKYEKRQHRKQVLKTCLHVFSYICTGLFWLVCLIGLCSGSCSKSSSKLVVAHALSSDDTYQSRIFYPSDINTNPGKVKFYLHLDYRNYNLLKYHLPTGRLIDNYTSDIILDLPGDPIDNNTINLYLYDGLHYNSITGDLEGFTIPSLFGTALFSGLRLTRTVIGGSLNNYDFYLARTDGTRTYLYSTYNDYSSFDPLTPININGYNRYAYQVINWLFSDNVFFTFKPRFNNMAIDTYGINHFFAYYYSNYSFDFNGYQFGGSAKYLSTSYLFNNVYNGCFIYNPDVQDVGNHALTGSAILSQTMSYKIFSGLWEYENTLYSDIWVNLLPAWNYNFSYPSVSTTNYTYKVHFYHYDRLGNPVDWVDSVLSGNNESLINYYFISSMYMRTYDNTKTVTLAYNNVTYSTVTHVDDLDEIRVYCNLNENPLLYQSDSFINNNSTKFILYRVDYNRYFSEGIDQNFLPISSYQYYSDFFFGAFVYTGLYNTVMPSGNNNIGTNIFNPVFTIFKNGLSGLLPFLSFEMLPGITFGVILMMPFAVTLILFVVRLFKR